MLSDRPRDSTYGYSRTGLRGVHIVLASDDSRPGRTQNTASSELHEALRLDPRFVQAKYYLADAYLADLAQKIQAEKRVEEESPVRAAGAR
jgi:hypothetical protein